MKRILVLEDDYDIGEIVEMTLNSTYQVMVKKDCRQLEEALTQFKPDLILIDNFIGDRSAVEIIEEVTVKGFPINVPMILFSAHEEIRSLANQIGAADHLSKPFDLTQLHQCVSRVMALAAQH